MTIEIDYNNDVISIDGEDIINFSARRINSRDFQVLLEELFNRIDCANVTFQVVDEDSRTIIGEW